MEMDLVQLKRKGMDLCIAVVGEDVNSPRCFGLGLIECAPDASREEKIKLINYEAERYFPYINAFEIGQGKKGDCGKGYYPVAFYSISQNIYKWVRENPMRELRELLPENFRI